LLLFLCTAFLIFIDFYLFFCYCACKCFSHLYEEQKYLMLYSSGVKVRLQNQPSQHFVDRLFTAQQHTTSLPSSRINTNGNKLSNAKYKNLSEIPCFSSKVPNLIIPRFNQWPTAPPTTTCIAVTSSGATVASVC